VKSEVGLFIEVEEATVRVVERSLSEAVALDEGSILKIEDIQLDRTAVNAPKVRRKAGRGRRGRRGVRGGCGFGEGCGRGRARVQGKGYRLGLGTTTKRLVGWKDVMSSLGASSVAHAKRLTVLARLLFACLRLKITQRKYCSACCGVR